MDQQWSQYADSPSAGRQARYAPQGQPQQHTPGQLPSMKTDPYVTSAVPSRAQSMSLGGHSAAPSRGPYNGDGDGDVQMEDADPYNRAKHDGRPGHSRMNSAQMIQQEESTAARRYSPMNLSPASPYAATPQQHQHQQQAQFAAFTPNMNVNSQSPTRSNFQVSPSQHGYYSPPASRPHAPQLPPLQSALSPEGYYPQTGSATMSTVYGRGAEPKSPVRATASTQPPPHAQRGPVPKFSKCSRVSELQPRVNDQPPFRRANPEGGFLSPLQALTTQLPATYRICNPGFKYESSRNPRRVLTKPSKGVKNDGYDNEDSDYILYVNDILGSEEAGHKNRYLILDVLGQGTFGQVVKCQNLRTQEVVAVKVVKNRTAYFNQSMMEVSVLDLLNKQMDKHDDHHILRLKDTFIHRQHLCLVFELLSVNLYELIKQNQFRGLSTTLVRVFAQQLLNGLSLLGKAKLIHCDLKPENILLKNLESPIIKIIDFGSACDERQTVYTYIQSRFYRSPEVLLGLPYSAAIDMWSLGCIVVELFLGLPLFPGSSEYNQVSRITEMLGLPPTWMLEMGKQSGEFFEKYHDDYGRRHYRLKSMQQYSQEHNTKEQPSKKYFSATTLPDIIRNYPMPRKNMKPGEVEREMANRAAFIDFAKGLLNLNPLERWTPAQARLHPFITQAKYTGEFIPPMTLKQSSSKSPAPGVQEQQRAEALSNQRAVQAQAARAQAAQQQAAQTAALAYQSPGLVPQAMTPAYPQSPAALQSPAASAAMYNNMYSPNHQGAPPPYQQQPAAYSNPPLAMLPQQPQGQQNYNQRVQTNLHAQAATRAGRQRASTMEFQQGGIPPAIQRVISHLDPNAPIRLQPSPAYYPPPPDGADSNMAGSRRRSSRTGSRRDFIRNLEDRTLEEGFMNTNHWQ